MRALRLLTISTVITAACAGQSLQGGAVAPSSSARTSPELPARVAPAQAEAESGGQLAQVLSNAAGEVQDPDLRALLEDHWRFVLESKPLFATQLGLRAFDDRLSEGSAEAIARERADKRALLARAEAIDTARLSPEDAETLALFREDLETDLESEPCRFEEWSLSPRDNPITQWNYLPELHTVTSKSDLENLLARYHKIPRAIDDRIDALRRGARDGLFANRESTKRVLAMVRRQLDEPLERWPLAAPARDPRIIALGSTQAATLLETVRAQIRPALERYGRALEQEILPHAREGRSPGLAELPFGPACYAARIRRFTTLPLDAETLHRTGLTEIERIDREMAALGKRLFGEDDRLEVLRRLRTDPGLHFQDAAAIEAKARDALARAKAAIPKFFGVLPKADCIVRRIPDYEAPYTTIAYYRQPAPDGKKPGEYFVNVYAPKTRPIYEAEALAYHESIPGHHLQLAIMQELPALPEFRKHLGMTVFVEGWALYTEQLADEMDLYSGDLDRMGMLSYEAWRAARLVVDTGLHAFGWSREKAQAFMRAHTALADNNIDNEVDRYIVWPGQALAYKVGQLEIWRLRRAAEARLGERFDLPGFHDAVLRGGAVTLPVLRERVERWAAEVEAPPSPPERTATAAR